MQYVQLLFQENISEIAVFKMTAILFMPPMLTYNYCGLFNFNPSQCGYVISSIIKCVMK